MQDNYFDVHEYIKATFPDTTLKEFVEDHGQNGLDMLYTSEDAEEVNTLLKDYRD